VTALADRLRRELPVEAVYVFGSFARGAEHEGSDIDLLVVGDLPGRAPDRIDEVLGRICPWTRSSSAARRSNAGSATARRSSYERWRTPSDLRDGSWPP
jgi:hypothetical protein